METPPPSNTPTFDVGPQAPTPTLRRQESLEHILNFTILNSPPSSPSEVVEASFIYHQILADCEHDGPARIPPRHPRPVSINPTNPSTQRGQQAGGGAGSLPGIAEGGSDVLEDASSPSPNDDNDNDDEASTSPLVHELFAALYEHGPTVQGQANIVRLVLHALFGPSSPDNHTSALQRPLEVILPLARAWPTYTSEQKGGVYGALTILAVELLDCFFVPFLSQGNHTPTVRSSLISPTSRSEIDPTAQATYSRLQSLRHLCRSRDGNRCVITHQQGHVPTRGRRRQISSQPSVHLECAHIIPHSLNQAGAGGHLADDKTVLWRILNMFDPGVSLLLQGERIDGPANAMMLYPELHSRFGLLHWYLEEVPGGGGGDDDEAVYVFCRSRGAPLLPLHCMPAGPGGTVRFTRMDGSRTELPSRRLLAVHRACAKILEVAGAAEYVEDLLDEFEDVRGMTGLAGDGSSDLAMLVRVGVGLGEGWFHCEREREGIAV